MLVALAMRQSLKLPRALLRPSLIAGVAQVLFVYGVYAAITSINISLALLILYVYPIVLAIHQHRLGTIKIHKAQWLCALVACSGLMLILGVRFEEINLLGILPGTDGHARHGRHYHHQPPRYRHGRLARIQLPHEPVWSLFIFSAVLLLLAANTPSRKPHSGWIALGGNGVAYCVAWVAFFAGARILGATRASMLTLIEPPGRRTSEHGSCLGNLFTAAVVPDSSSCWRRLFTFEKLSYPDV